jgi:hypothetical protein
VARAPPADEDHGGGHTRYRHDVTARTRARDVGESKLRCVQHAFGHPAIMPRRGVARPPAGRPTGSFGAETPGTCASCVVFDTES